MAAAFSAQISGQIPGWPAATRVMSRKPPAARRRRVPSCSAPSVAAFISAAATRCGTWDTTATSRSWSAAERTSTSAPRLITTPLSRLKDSRSVAAVGVSTQTAPSKRSGSAPCRPVCSDPAMGCPPMKRGWSASSTMAVLTPLTSVTTASARRPPSSRKRRATPATAAAGVATKTTSAVGSSPAASITPVSSAAPSRSWSASMPETCQPASPQPERDGTPDQARPDDECPPARPGVSRGGHRGALGHRGDRCD